MSHHYHMPCEHSVTTTWLRRDYDVPYNQRTLHWSVLPEWDLVWFVGLGLCRCTNCHPNPCISLTLLLLWAVALYLVGNSQGWSEGCRCTDPVLLPRQQAIVAYCRSSTHCYWRKRTSCWNPNWTSPEDWHRHYLWWRVTKNVIIHCVDNRRRNYYYISSMLFWLMFYVACQIIIVTKFSILIPITK